MLRVITRDALTFEARDHQGVVEALRKRAWMNEKTTEEYMRQVARRCKLWNGAYVPTDSYEQFVRGLQMAGLVAIFRN